jgi:hypothetical protein
MVDFFALFALISTGGSLYGEPMEPRNMATSAMEFGSLIDESLCIFVAGFDDGHSFSITEFA